MRPWWLILPVVALGSTYAPAGPGGSGNVPGCIYSDVPRTVVRALQASFEADKVSLEADVDGPAAPEVYFDRDRSTVNFDFHDVDSGAVTSPGLAHDDLVSGWHVDHPTFRRAVWVVNLRYLVGGDDIDVQTSPGKTIVTLRRVAFQPEAWHLTPGVDWLRQGLLADGHLLTVNQLHVNLKDKAVRFEVGLAHDNTSSVESVGTLVDRRGALAGVNGGFFERHQGPLGLVFSQGKTVVPPVGFRPPRTALGFLPDGHVVMDQVKVEDGHLVGLHGSDWSHVTMAIGGGPRLLQQGQVDVTAAEEGLGPDGNNITYRAARTAIGVLPHRQLVLVTVRGSMDGDRGGLLFDEMAGYMRGLGCTDAMCLDGGGSTAMAVAGNVVDHIPGARDERPVADALLLYDTGPVEFPSRLALRVDHPTAAADGVSVTEATARVMLANGQPVPDGTAVDFSTSLGDPLGQVKTQGGEASVRFKAPPVPVTTQVRATCATAQDYAVVRYSAGAAAHLYARATLTGSRPTPVPIVFPPSPSPSPSPSTTVLPGQPLLLAQIVDTPSPTETPSPSASLIDVSPEPSTPVSPSETPAPSVTPPAGTSAPEYLVDVLVTDAVGNPLVGEAVTADWTQDNQAQHFTRATDSNGVITVEAHAQPGGVALHFSHATAGSIALTLPDWR